MMETRNVFRYKQSTRIFSLIISVLLFVFFGSMLLDWPDLDGLSDRIAVGDYPSIWSILGFLVLGSLIALEMWLFLNIGLYSFFYKITVGNNAMEISGRDFFLRKFFNNINNGYFLGGISFEDIAFVDTDVWKPGMGKFLLKDNRTVLVGIRSLENHGEFIKLLKEKLDPIQIGEGIEKLARPKRFGVLQSVIFMVALLPTFFLMTETFFKDELTKIWNEELSAWGVNDITMDNDGSIWISAGGYKDDSYIWHLSDTRREHWKLPYEICKDCSGLSAVSHNANNQPIIIDYISSNDASSGKVKAYVWNGTSWDQSTLYGDFFDDDGGNTLETAIWGIQDNNLVNVDFSTGQRIEFSFPELALSGHLRLLDIKMNSDGSLLTLFVTEDKPQYFYHFSDGEWQGPILTTSEEERLWAFCQGAAGTIWAIVSENGDAKTNTNNARIGYYNTATSSWDWKAFISGEPDRSIAYFEDMAIDGYGRIWVSGVYEPRTEDDNYISFVRVFQPSGEGLDLIVEYTDKNSNIDRGGQIVIAGNRIWLEDYNLRWIDIQTEQLPSHLPNWVVSGFDILDENFGWFIVILIGQFALIFFANSLENK